MKRDHTRGRAECPCCHACKSHEILTMTPNGYPLKVRCPACGETWTYYTPGELYKRKVERERRQSRAWNAKNKERKAELECERYAKRRAAVLAEREHTYKTCKACGASFAVADNDPRIDYCSEGCRREAVRFQAHSANVMRANLACMRMYYRLRRMTRCGQRQGFDMEERWQRMQEKATTIRLAGSTTRCSPSLSD